MVEAHSLAATLELAELKRRDGGVRIHFRASTRVSERKMLVQDLHIRKHGSFKKDEFCLGTDRA